MDEFSELTLNETYHHKGFMVLILLMDKGDHIRPFSILQSSKIKQQ